MIFDFHTHCFPDRIAARAVGKVAFECGGMIPATDGTFEGLKNAMKEGGVHAFAPLSIATSPAQMTNVNNYSASLIAENVYPFGSIHPDGENAQEELERIKELGLYGVKLHPEYQGFFVDDEKMKPIYKKISELGLPLILHSGKNPGFSAPCHCTPERLAKALKWLDTPVIAAHWGALQLEDEVLTYLCSLPVYFDTSQGSGIIPRNTALKIIEKHGCDKLLFASDTPWGTPEKELRLLNTLGLSDSERADILWNNAMTVLGK
ncbi:MAG: amidohydrolase [Clostridia bacterium]|nr:amidohydrolase [Clostridia bacterium]